MLTVWLTRCSAQALAWLQPPLRGSQLAGIPFLAQESGRIGGAADHSL